MTKIVKSNFNDKNCQITISWQKLSNQILMTKIVKSKFDDIKSQITI